MPYTTAVADSFVRAVTFIQDLDSHTASVGGQWALAHRTSAFNLKLVIQTTSDEAKVSGNEASAVFVYNNTDPARECRVSLDVLTHDTSTDNPPDNVWGIFARYADTANAYGVAVLQGTGDHRLTLYKRVAGTTTQLGQVTVTSTGTRQVQLVCHDSSKEAWWDGTSRLTSTDNSLGSAGKAGIFCGMLFDSSHDIDGENSFDNFLAENWTNPTVTYTPTTDIDGILARVYEMTASLDSVLDRNLENASLDAVLARLVELTTGLDAQLQPSLGLDLDALIQRGFTQAADLDAVLLNVLRATVGLDSYLIKTWERKGWRTVDWTLLEPGETQIAKTQALRAEVGATLRRSNTITSSLDALIPAYFRVRNAAINAILQAGAVYDVSLDAILRGAVERTASMDAFLLRQQAGQLDLPVDAILTENFTLTASVDARLIRLTEVVAVLNAILTGSVTKTASVEAILSRSLQTKTASIDANLTSVVPTVFRYTAPSMGPSNDGNEVTTIAVGTTTRGVMPFGWYSGSPSCFAADMDINIVLPSNTVRSTGVEVWGGGNIKIVGGEIENTQGSGKSSATFEMEMVAGEVYLEGIAVFSQSTTNSVEDCYRGGGPEWSPTNWTIQNCFSYWLPGSIDGTHSDWFQSYGDFGDGGNAIRYDKSASYIAANKFVPQVDGTPRKRVKSYAAGAPIAISGQNSFILSATWDGSRTIVTTKDNIVPVGGSADVKLPTNIFCYHFAQYVGANTIKVLTRKAGSFVPLWTMHWGRNLKIEFLDGSTQTLAISERTYDSNGDCTVTLSGNLDRSDVKWCQGQANITDGGDSSSLQPSWSNFGTMRFDNCSFTAEYQGFFIHYQQHVMGSNGPVYLSRIDARYAQVDVNSAYTGGVGTSYLYWVSNETAEAGPNASGRPAGPMVHVLGPCWVEPRIGQTASASERTVWPRLWRGVNGDSVSGGVASAWWSGQGSGAVGGLRFYTTQYNMHGTSTADPAYFLIGRPPVASSRFAPPNRWTGNPNHPGLGYVSPQGS